MKLAKKSVAGGLVSAVLAGGFLLGMAGTASAAAAPTFEPDPASKGSVSFYDATGHQITSGSITDSPLAAYYAASGGALNAGDTLAYVSYATPQDGVPTLSWTTNEQWTAASTFSPAPSYPGSLAGNTNAVVKGAATDGGLDVHIAAFPNASAANPGVYQVRLYTSSTNVTSYYSSDILVSGNTWTQVYPAVATATSTALAATPNPSTVGDTVTLNATVTPAAAGTVQFKDGATNLGTPVAVSAAGAASTTTSSLSTGSHSLSAVFTPTDPTAFAASTGTFTATVNPPATATSTTLSVSGGYLTAGSAASLSASVTAGATPVGAGTVAFYDNGSATPIPGTVTSATAGTYVLDLPSGFTAGGHSVVAKFTPTDVTVYTVSQSAGQSFLTQAALVGACAQPGSQCTTTANVQATVPVGTLAISTPYTSAAPLDLGTLALSADSKVLSASKPFQHIVVSDTRSGNLPWTVQAIASNLSDGGTNPNSVINAQNIGLTGVAKVTAGAGFLGALTATDNAAANGVAPGDTGSLGLGGSAPHTVIAADHGLGTVDMSGTLTLIAPASTEPGLFTGTITFTVG